MDEDLPPRNLQISRLFPNMVTLMALCAGLSSVRFAIEHRWELAVSLVMLAALIDVIDGRLARFLHTASNFGAQLDSLADFFNFCIAPAIILYLWSTSTFPVKGIGWAFVLFFAVCGAIRLARFNCDYENEADMPAWKGNFFMGVPSTMAGIISLTPMMLSFEFENQIKVLSDPKFVGAFMVILALLMPSRVPSFATKKLTINRKYAYVIMASAGLIITALIIAPWLVLPIIAAIYLAMIPVSAISYMYLNNKNK
jgi:CDP-diacylglycerol---serine O-phosphatidyltransferase